MELNTDFLRTAAIVVGTAITCSTFFWKILAKLLKNKEEEIINKVKIENIEKKVEEIEKDVKDVNETLNTHLRTKQW